MILKHCDQSDSQHRPWFSFRGLCLGFLAASLVLTAGCATGSGGTTAAAQEDFATPEDAAEALIVAAETYDVEALTRILGPEGVDLVVTGDPVQDRNQSLAFAAQARVKTQIDRVPLDPKVAILSVGAGDWPVPMPIVEEGGRWLFDTEAGREELLYRRVGSNEFDAIDVCLGYVDAQYEYALVKHDGALVNQYAQRVISTPGTQDGLAWQAPDGTWEGPLGEGIALVIAEGYTERFEPYHGYYFKVLKGQGPDAPLGEMDFVVKGAMIGGFAMAAAPVDYGLTGVKTFIVSHEGIVYEQDLGPTTLDQFRAMELYNPDTAWEPVAQE
ncbi:MAG: DUF2950 domain-containing protein [Thermoanaerobaculales bacterium]|nr:DUF2950 domain-containing protein [Thermoanaerobaculales bacterium]